MSCHGQDYLEIVAFMILDLQMKSGQVKFFICTDSGQLQDMEHSFILVWISFASLVTHSVD